MPTARLLTGLLLPLLWCCGPVSHSPVSPLDYLELRTPDGWSLRVHGDGSGSLTHRQHPLHHLDYPARTFSTRLFPGRGRRCRAAPTGSACYALSFYAARGDSTLHCDCVTGQEPQALMRTAITHMQLAVDDAGSERSCRMLRRTWLAAN
ncbi:hypothetical protein LEM8419_01863 [Neolewinella maritima]|uniref:Secreted protein n=1 Tax=Neolewinella maritima TaxID=1383882 RepID=A0ABM9B1B5_9BACT|nr:hypothetical protein [Neolewinella maritima]CAH1000745.1 hypothetical protein LEM8419_01863 [Neolewinella maritima]